MSNLRVQSFDGFDLTGLIKSFEIAVSSAPITFPEEQGCFSFLRAYIPADQGIKCQFTVQSIDEIEKILPNQRAVKITIPRKYWFDYQYSFDAQVSSFEILPDNRGYSYNFHSGNWDIDADRGYLARFLRWITRRQGVML